MFCPLPADEANHSPNENMEIGLFLMGIRTGAALLRRFGQLQAGPQGAAVPTTG